MNRLVAITGMVALGIGVWACGGAAPTAAPMPRPLAYALPGNHAEARRDVDRAVELGISRTALEPRVEGLKQRP